MSVLQVVSVCKIPVSLSHTSVQLKTILIKFTCTSHAVAIKTTFAHAREASKSIGTYSIGMAVVCSSGAFIDI